MKKDKRPTDKVSEVLDCVDELSDQEKTQLIDAISAQLHQINECAFQEEEVCQLPGQIPTAQPFVQPGKSAGIRD